MLKYFLNVTVQSSNFLCLLIKLVIISEVQCSCGSYQGIFSIVPLCLYQLFPSLHFPQGLFKCPPSIAVKKQRSLCLCIWIKSPKHQQRCF